MLDGRRVPAAGENRIGQARSSLGRREERVFVRWKGCGPLHRYLLFDLDARLTDPAEGITKCVQYALASLGRENPDKRSFIVISALLWQSPLKSTAAFLNRKRSWR